MFEECYQINPQTDGIKGPGAQVSVCTDWCDPQKMYMDIRWQVPQLKFAEHCHMFAYVDKCVPLLSESQKLKTPKPALA